MRATRAFECVMTLSIAITSTFPWRWFLASFMLDETSSFTSAQTQTQTYRQGGLHSQTYAYLQRLAQRHPFPAPHACTRIHTTLIHRTLTHNTDIHTTLTYQQHLNINNTDIHTTHQQHLHTRNTDIHTTLTYTQHLHINNTDIHTTLTYTQHLHINNTYIYTHNTDIHTTPTYTQHSHTHNTDIHTKTCMHTNTVSRTTTTTPTHHRTHHPPPPPPPPSGQGCQCILRQPLTSLPASAIHSITIGSVAAISQPGFTSFWRWKEMTMKEIWLFDLVWLVGWLNSVNADFSPKRFCRG